MKSSEMSSSRLLKSQILWVAMLLFFATASYAVPQTWIQSDWDGGSGQTDWSVDSLYSSDNGATDLSVDGEVSINNDVSVGDGADGALTVSAANTVVNTYTYITAATTNSGQKDVVVNSVAGLAIGDEVIVMQMQHADSSGNWEIRTISAINTLTLTLDSNLTHNYYSGTFDQASASAAQVIRVPNYTDVTFNASTSIRATPWTGYVGGLVAFRASGTVSFGASSEIRVDSAGYRGGVVGLANNAPGTEGEGILGLGVLSTTISPYVKSPTGVNTGGAGGPGVSHCGGGGGGGGYVTVGGIGQPSTAYADTAYGGNTAGVSDLYSKIYLGGAGGGGGDDDNRGTDADGGNGGGMVILFVDSIYNATVYSRGESKPNTNDCASAEGSGGAGGSIFIHARSINTATLDASGGTGANVAGTNGNGGDGSVGRIRVEYVTASAVSTTGSYTTKAIAFADSTVVTSSILHGESLKTGLSGPFKYGSSETLNGGSVVVSMRTGNSSGELTGRSFTAITKDTRVTPSGGIVAGDSLFQYKVVITRSGLTPPVFDSIHIELNEAPTAPVLASPVDSVEGIDLSPVFDWSDATDENTLSGDGIKYTLEVSTASDFGTLAFRKAGLSLSTYNMGDTTVLLTDNTEYYWRVYARDSLPDSTISTTSRIYYTDVANNTPGLPAPLNFIASDEFSPTDSLGWTRADADPKDVLTYRIVLDNNADFSTPEVDQSAISGTRIRLSDLTQYANLVDDEQYYFIVQGTDDHAATGSFSSAVRFYFNQVNDTPLQPSGLAPAADSVARAGSDVLNWTSSDGDSIGNTPDTITYTVEISAAASFTVIISSTSLLDQDSVVLSNVNNYGSLSNGSLYYWRVRATDNHSASSANSATKTFTYISSNTNPTDPALTGPASETLVDSTQLMAWSASTDANIGDSVWYLVQVSSAADFSDTLIAKEVASTSVALNAIGTIASLTENSQHWLRVYAKDSRGGISGFDSLNFWLNHTATAPTVPAFSNFTSDTLLELTHSIAWTTSTDPDPSATIKYRVEADDASDFSSVDLRVDDITAVTRTLWELIDFSSLNANDSLFFDDKTMYFRVRSIDNAGDSSAWSTVTPRAYLNTQNDTATLPVISVPTASQVLASADTIKWSVSTHNDARETWWYEVQVALDQETDFAPVLSHDTIVSANNFIRVDELKAFASMEDDSLYIIRLRSMDSSGNSFGYTDSVVFQLDTNGVLTDTTAETMGGGLTGPFRLTWNEVLNGGTVSMAVRTSSDGSFTGRSFTAVSNGALISATAGSIVKGETFIQIRKSLTKGPTLFPAVTAVSMEYNASPSAVASFVSPADSVESATLNPVFDWADATDANTASIDVIQYILEIDDNADFSSPVLRKREIPASTYNLADTTFALTDNTKYFWRVYSIDTYLDSTISSVSRVLYTDVSNDAPTAPSPLNISNNDERLPSDSLGWTRNDADPKDILTYRVVIDDNADLSSPVVDTSTVSGTRILVSELGSGYASMLDDGIYYWAVQAKDPDLASSAFTTTGNFLFNKTNDTPLVPSSLLPSVDSTSRDSLNVLNWTSSDGDSLGNSPDTITYTLEIAAASSFAVIISTTNLLDQDSIVLKNVTNFSSLADGTVYFWRVRATDNHSASSTNSVTKTFRYITNNNLPTAPVVSGPAASSVIDTIQVLSWTASTDSDVGDSVWYVVQVSSLADYSDTLISSAVASTSIALNAVGSMASLTENATHYWRVRSEDSRGGVSTFSASNFDLDHTNENPTEPALSQFTNDTLYTLTDTVHWTAATDADPQSSVKYRVEADDASDFSSVDLRVDELTVLKMSLQALIDSSSLNQANTAFFDDKTMFFRVRAIDNENDSSSWSSVTPKAYLNTADDTPTATSLTRPTANQEISASDSLMWGASTHADARESYYYQVQVSGELNTDFSSPISTDTIVSSSLFKVINSLAGYGSMNDAVAYIARIRSFDSTGNVSAWSDSVRFILDTNGVQVDTVLDTMTAGFNGPFKLNWTEVLNGGSVTVSLRTAATALGLSAKSFTGITKDARITPSGGIAYDEPYIEYIITRNKGTDFPVVTNDTVIYNAAPSSLSLLLPADSAESSTLNPIFDWADATDANTGDGDALTYILEVDDNSDFSSLVLRKADIPGSTYNVADTTLSLSDNTKYFWRVWAKDAYSDSTLSATSRVVYTDVANDAPGLPTPISPADNFERAPTDSLTWTRNDADPKDVLTYRIVIDNNSDLASPEVDTSGVLDIAVAISDLGSGYANLVDDGIYYWIVEATDPDAAGSGFTTSRTFYFNKVNDTPLLPSSLLPSVNGTARDSNDILSWSSSDGDSLGNMPDTLTYRVEISANVSFSPSIGTTVLPNDQDSVRIGDLTGFSNLSDGVTYYWRTWATDNHGLASAASSGANTFVYILSNSVPASPVQLLPVSASTIDTTTALTWNLSSDINVGDSVWYVAQLSTSRTFADTARSLTLADTQMVFADFTGMTSLADNIEYFWRVRAEDSRGGVSVFDLDSVVLNKANDLPTDPSFAGFTDSMQILLADVISWNASTDADPGSSITYSIEGSTASDFASITLSQSSLAGTSVSLSALIAANESGSTTASTFDDLNYHFRVRALDDQGASSGNSVVKVGYLNTVDDTPTATALTFPTADTIISSSENIQWSAASHEDQRESWYYGVQVTTSADLSFATPVSTDTVVSSITTKQVSDLNGYLSMVDGAAYLMRVRSFDSTGNVSAWSTAVRCTLSTSGVIIEIVDSTMVAGLTGPFVMTWSEVLNGGTVKMELRTSSIMGDFSGRTWTQIYSGTQIAPVTGSIDKNQSYIQYRLTRTKGTAFPTVTNVLLEYNDEPTQVNLFTPAEGSEASLLQPAFNWSDATDANTASGDAITYVLEIDDANDFSTPVIRKTGLATSDHTLSGTDSLLDNTTYWWRVYSKDSYLDSTVSASRHFFTDLLNDVPGLPTPLTPADYDERAPADSLGWTRNDTDPGDTLVYHLILDDSPAFTSAEIDTTGILDLNVALQDLSQYANLVDDAVYYWIVEAIDPDSALSGFSASRRVYFNKVNDRPALPNTLQPALNATARLAGDSLHWFADDGDSLGNTPDTLNYTVQVSSVADFSTILSTTTLDSNGARISDLSNYGNFVNGSEYYWRVWATDNHSLRGDTTAGANTFTFISGNSLPADPVILLPSTGSVVDTTSTLRWNLSSDANVGDSVWYVLQLSTSETYSDTVRSLSLADTFMVFADFTNMAGLTDDQTYWWRVRAQDSRSGSSAFDSDSLVLNKGNNTPSVPAFVGFTDSMQVLLPDLISWSASTDSDPGDAVSYIIQASPVSNFSSVDITVTGWTPVAATLDTLIDLSAEGNPSNFFDDKNYYFRVRAVDLSGDSSAWSASNWGYLNTVDDVPTANTLTSPTADKIMGASDSIQWTASTHEDQRQTLYYHVQVANSSDASFASPVSNDSGVTALSLAMQDLSGFASMLDGSAYLVRARAYDSTANASAFTTAVRCTLKLTDVIITTVDSVMGGSNTGPFKLTWSEVLNGGTVSIAMRTSAAGDFSGRTYTAVSNNVQIAPVTGSIDKNHANIQYRITRNKGPTDFPLVSNVLLTYNSVPTAPVLATPVDSVEDADLTPIFDWSDATDANSSEGDLVTYILEVDDNSDFSSPILRKRDLALSTYDMNDSTVSLTDNSVYYWRSWSIDSYNDSTVSTTSRVLFSDVSNDVPGLPTPITPADNDERLPADSLGWTRNDADPKDVLTYQLRIDTSLSFAAPVLDSSGILDVSIAMSDLSRYASLEDDRVYYWTVEATDPSAAKSGFTTVRTFVMNKANDKALLPYDLSPVTDSIAMDLNDVLRWKSSDGDSLGNSADVLTYTVQLSTDAGFSGIVSTTSGLAVDTLRLGDVTNFGSLVNGNVYFWRTWATDNHGLDSDTTSGTNTITFISANSNPSDPIALTPASGSIVDTNQVLDWSASIDANIGDSIWYNLQLSALADFSIILRSVNVAADSMAFADFGTTHLLTDNITYWWRVRAEDDRGGATAYDSANVILNMGNSLPSTPSFVGFTDSMQILAADTIHWSTSTDADPGSSITYTVEASTAVDFSSVTLSKSSIVATKIALDALIAANESGSTALSSFDDQNWYFRVRAVDDQAAASANSASNWAHLNTVDDTPTLPALTFPTADTILFSNSNITWSAATHQDERESWFYNVQVTTSADVSFASPVSTDTVVSSLLAKQVSDLNGFGSMSDGLAYLVRMSSFDSTGNVSGWTTAVRCTLSTTGVNITIADSTMPANFTGPFVMTWSEVLNGGTVKMEVRTSSVNGDFSGRTWTEVTSGTQITPVAGSIDKNQIYVQHRLTRTQGTSLPVVSNILLEYNDEPTGSALASPSYGTEQANLQTVFDWSDATDVNTGSGDVVSYILEIDDNSDFASLALRVSGISLSTYTLGAVEALNDNTKYWYRVYSKDLYSDSTLSDTLFFYTDVTNEAPTASTPFNIVDNDERSSTDSLGWTRNDVDPGDTLSYRIVIDDNSNFASPEVDTSLVVGTRIQMAALGSGYANLVDDVTYYWKVDATDPHGLTSGLSPTGIFWFNPTNDAPVMPHNLLPANAIARDSNDYLSWRSEDPDSLGNTPDVLVYTLEIASSAAFSTVLASKTAYAIDSISLKNLDNFGNLVNGVAYNWRVFATDNHGLAGSVTDGSLTFTYISGNTAPTAPVISAPTSQSIADTNTVLQWSASTDSDPGDSVFYRVALSTLADYSDTLRTVDIAGTSMAFSAFGNMAGLSDDQTYYWRVEARDTRGSGSAYDGSDLILNKGNNNPAVPQFVGLSNSLQILAGDTIHWSVATDSDPLDTVSYRIEGSTLADFSSVDLTLVSTRDDSVTLSAFIAASSEGNGLAFYDDRDYYLRVRAEDKNGGVSAWSTDYLLYLNTEDDTPTATSIVQPSLNEVMLAGDTVAWSVSTHADQRESWYYELQVTLASDASFLTPVSVDTLPAGANARQLDELTGFVSLQDDSTYLVRVRSFDSTGNSTGFSSAVDFSFKTGNTFISITDTTMPGGFNGPYMATWNEILNGGTVIVELRTATTQGGLSAKTFTVVANGAKITPTGGIGYDESFVQYRITYILGGTIFPEVSGFSIEFNEAPTAVTLITPASGIETSDLTPALAWNTATDANTSDVVGYTLEIDDNSDFSSLLLRKEGMGTPFYTLSAGEALSDNSIYYWRIVSKDSYSDSTVGTSGHFFTDLANEAPTVPDPLSPTDGTERAAADTIAWIRNDVDLGDTLSYRLIIAPTATFTSPVVDTSGIAVEKISLQDLSQAANLVDNTLYYWVVEATDPHGLTSGFSTVGTFVYNSVNDVPGLPFALLPANGTGRDSTDRLYWSSNDADSLGNTPDVLSYTVELASSASFASVLSITTGISADSVVLGNLTSFNLLQDDSTYYWRIFATDNHGAVSATTDGTQNFVAIRANDVPALPASLGPASGTVMFTSHSLYWDPSVDPNPGDSVFYKVQLSDQADFSVILREQNVADTFAVISDFGNMAGLTDNQPYYWRVQAIDSRGGVSAFSASDFQLDKSNSAPTTPEFSGFVANSEILMTTTLTWTQSTDVDPGSSVTYEVEAATDASFTTVDLRVTGLSAVLSRTFSQLVGVNEIANDSAVFDDVDYWFRVRAVDNNAAPSAWSATIQGLVNTFNDTPTAPSLTRPDSNGHELYLTDNLEWLAATHEDVRESFYYELEVATLADTFFVSSISLDTTAGTALAINSLNGVASILQDGSYWVRVRSFDSTGNTSAYSTSLYFTNITGNDPPSVPNGLVPADSATASNPSVSLVWNASTDDNADVITYEAMLWQSGSAVPADTSAAVAYYTGITLTSINLKTLTGYADLRSGSIYHWSVEAVDEHGARSGRSATSSLLFESNKAVQVVIASPIDSAEIGATVNLQWSASSLVDPGPVDTLGYIITMSTSPVFADTALVDTLGTNSVVFNTLTMFGNVPINSYIHWRVQAVDNHGQGSDVSLTEVFYFNNGNLKPDAPSNIFPVNGNSRRDFQALSWTGTDPNVIDIPNLSYYLEIDDHPLFPSPTCTTTVVSVMSVRLDDFTNCVGNLVEGQDYYWRVRASDVSLSSDFSTTGRFVAGRTDEPAAVPTIAVPDSAGELHPSTTLNVLRGADADDDSLSTSVLTWTVQISETQNFASVLLEHSGIVDGASMNLVATDIANLDTLNHGSQYWIRGFATTRVDTFDLAGDTSVSRPFTFVVDTATILDPVAYHLDEFGKPVQDSMGLIDEFVFVRPADLSAAAYTWQLQVSSDNSFSDTVSYIAATASGDTIRHDLSDLVNANDLAHGNKYYMRVFATTGVDSLDYGNRPAGTSDFEFVILRPYILNPLASFVDGTGETVTDTLGPRDEVIYRKSAVMESADYTYIVQISSVNDYSDTLATATLASGASLDSLVLGSFTGVQNLNHLQHYYLRVLATTTLAENDFKNKPTAESDFVFRLENPVIALPVPSQTDSTGKLVVDTLGALSRVMWRHSTDMSPGEFSYTVQISSGENFTDTLASFTRVATGSVVSSSDSVAMGDITGAYALVSGTKYWLRLITTTKVANRKYGNRPLAVEPFVYHMAAPSISSPTRDGDLAPRDSIRISKHSSTADAVYKSNLQISSDSNFTDTLAWRNGVTQSGQTLDFRTDGLEGISKLVSDRSYWIRSYVSVLSNAKVFTGSYSTSVRFRYGVADAELEIAGSWPLSSATLLDPDKIEWRTVDYSDVVYRVTLMSDDKSRTVLLTRDISAPKNAADSLGSVDLQTLIAGMDLPEEKFYFWTVQAVTTTQDATVGPAAEMRYFYLGNSSRGDSRTATSVWRVGTEGKVLSSADSLVAITIPDSTFTEEVGIRISFLPSRLYIANRMRLDSITTEKVGKVEYADNLLAALDNVLSIGQNAFEIEVFDLETGKEVKLSKEVLLEMTGVATVGDSAVRIEDPIKKDSIDIPISAIRVYRLDEKKKVWRQQLSENLEGVKREVRHLAKTSEIKKKKKPSVSIRTKHFSIYKLLAAGDDDAEFDNFKVFPSPVILSSDVEDKAKARIHFTIRQNTKIQVRIFSKTGGLVWKADRDVVHEGTTNISEEHEVWWDGRNMNGYRVGNGYYVVYLLAKPQGGKAVRVKQMIAVIK